MFNRRLWETCYNAVRALVVHEGEIRQRLWRAFVDGLVRLEPDKLPDDLRPQCRKILSALRDPSGAVNPQQHIAHMSIEDAMTVAGEIFDLYERVSEGRSSRKGTRE